MIRLLALLFLFIGFTASALWIAERPGNVQIVWQGYEIRMALGFFVGALSFLIAALLAVLLLIKGVLGTPKRLRQKHKLRRYEQAFEALDHTMTALALQDYKEAQRQLNKSQHYLRAPSPTIRLLGVQIAHATGKDASARETLDAMLEHSDTRPVALRGKIRELMQQQQWVHARDYAEEAFQARPHDNWLAMVLLDILFRDQDWQAVDAALTKAEKKKALNAAQARHYRALAALARAQQAMQATEPNAQIAQDAVASALKYQPSVMAWLLEARLAADPLNRKRLQHALTQGWSIMPHPQLAALFLAHGMDATAVKSLKRLQQMTHKHPEHGETLLLRAQLHLRFGDMVSARNDLKSALSKMESPRIYQQFAALEKAESDDTRKAAEWLSLAVNAPKDCSWSCTHCGTVHEEWEHHCNHCGQFDAIEWTRPEAQSPLSTLTSAP
jgi:HemY protein